MHAQSESWRRVSGLRLARCYCSTAAVAAPLLQSQRHQRHPRPHYLPGRPPTSTSDPYFGMTYVRTSAKPTTAATPMMTGAATHARLGCGDDDGPMIGARATDTMLAGALAPLLVAAHALPMEAAIALVAVVLMTVGASTPAAAAVAKSAGA